MPPREFEVAETPLRSRSATASAVPEFLAPNSHGCLYESKRDNGTMLASEGRVMNSMWKLGGLSWIALAKRVWTEINEDDVWGRAAQLAYIAERTAGFEAVRRGEIQRVRARLGNLSLDQENAIDSLSHALIERVLQAPMAMLKNARAGNQAVSVVETVRRLFNLRT